MNTSIDEQIGALKGMTVTELKHRFAEVFGEATRCNHRAYLIKRIAWRIQAMAFGGLSERARTRAKELANDADLRLKAPRKRPAPDASPGEIVIAGTIEPARDARLPLPGAVLTRVYKGQRIAVRVLPAGFEYDGRVFRSLTAVAKAVTGSHWNGNLFFGIAARGNAA